MCGIIGIFGNSDYRGPFQVMLESLRHRGPDSQGFYSSMAGEECLGARRLSIIDTSESGNQPFFDENKRFVSVFNGEIYNFVEVREELERLGHVFLSKCDTEVTVHAFEQWGKECVQKFNGMFAIAIYDTVEESLHLFRDRLGVKPLYYLEGDGFFAFSSEVKGFFPLKSLGWKPKLSRRAVEMFLTFNYVPDESLGIFRDVKKVPPGHYLEYKNKTVALTEYWRPHFGARTKRTFEEAVEEFEKELARSTRMRLVSDVPLGILLSGGIDSSTIAALATKYSGQKISTFTAVFKGQESSDERAFAQTVATHLNSDHHEIELDESRMAEDLEDFVSYFDDLSTGDAGLITTYVLCKKAREFGIKVLLVGEGADELLGGYSYFGLSKFPFSLLPGRAKAALFFYILSRPSDISEFTKWSKYVSDVLGRYEGVSFFDKINAFELCRSLPNHYLMKVDKGSMGASVEVRTPYLDYKLVEFVLTLPESYKLKGNFFSLKKANEKLILRKIAAKYLPHMISSRKKRGGMFPVAETLCVRSDLTAQYVLTRNIVSKHLYTTADLEKMFKKRKFKLTEFSRVVNLWRLLILEMWANKYIPEAAKYTPDELFA